MSDVELLRKSLLRDNRNGYDRMDAQEKPAMEAYCRDYMDFISHAKTERKTSRPTPNISSQGADGPDKLLNLRSRNDLNL